MKSRWWMLLALVCFFVGNVEVCSAETFATVHATCGPVHGTTETFVVVQPITRATPVNGVCVNEDVETDCIYDACGDAVCAIDDPRNPVNQTAFVCRCATEFTPQGIFLATCGADVTVAEGSGVKCREDYDPGFYNRTLGRSKRRARKAH